MKHKEPLLDAKNIIRSPIKKALFTVLRPGLEKIFGIEKLNHAYEEIRDKTTTPQDFAERVLNFLNIQYEIPEEDIERLRKIEGPMIMVSNHPFGGIEPLIMVLILSRIREEYKIMATNAVAKVTELSDALVYVDSEPQKEVPAGVKNIVPLKNILKYLLSGGLLAVFPAGGVSTFDFRSGAIHDNEWHPTIAKIIQRTGATVVPVYFHGQNSLMFQLAGLINQNLRKTMLIRELMKGDKKVQFEIGQKIPPARIQSFSSPGELNKYLKSKTYLLSAGFLSKVKLTRIKQDEVKQKMEPLIDPVPDEKIIEEISRLSGNDILAEKDSFMVFGVKKKRIPNVMREIGRLREVAFRHVGEGSGKPLDLDKFDDYYTQLILWDKENQKIAGGYRVVKSDQVLKAYGKHGLYTYSLFRIRKALFQQIGHALEIGRSFVTVEYQRHYSPLMLLWTAIGTYVRRNPDYKILFGPVSITADLNDLSKDLLVTFLQENNMDLEAKQMVKPRNKFKTKNKFIRNYYNSFQIANLGEVNDMISEIEDGQLGVPILLKHYLKLGGKLLAFNLDPEFSNVLDGLIMVDLTQTDQRILKRYMGDDGVKEFLAYHGVQA